MGAEIVLVRHGRTEWSVSGQHTGRTDIPLTEEGRAQAFELAKSTHVHGRSFGLVLASPLSRAWDTAQLAGLGGAAEVCDDLMEWDYGDVEGRTTPQVREQQPGWDLWVDGVGGGETVEDVGERVDRVIARIRDAGGDVALVAHGHVLRILAARWIGLDPRGGRHLGLETASVSVLGWERETPAVVHWNDTSHLS